MNARAKVERAVMRAVRQHALWSPGARLVVAVSGGADSLCLLGALLALRERHHPLAPGELIVAHLDHGLRGQESREDAQYVEQLAVELGLRCVVETMKAAPFGNASEDWARRQRYDFLRRVATEQHAERIVTGHTRDDQAETIVMHWLRGSGLAGLEGMAQLRENIARPLLTVTHEQTLAYCAARGWQPREDGSNADPRYLRNRVRHELLPLLETYNSGIRDLLIRNGELLADDEAYLEEQTQAIWAAIAHPDTYQLRPSNIHGTMRLASVRLDLEPLRDLHPAIRHRLFRAAANRLIDRDGFMLEARHIAAIDRQLSDGHTGTVLTLCGGLHTRLDYDALYFHDGGSIEIPTLGDQTRQWHLPVPGEVELPEPGWRLRAWRIEGVPGSEDAGELSPAPELPSLSFGGRPAEIGRAESRVYLDAATIGDHLTVRTWQPGDRFRPLGMTGSKKLQDYFGDARVPRALRSQVPLVFAGERLLWVAGLRIDDSVRLTTETAAVVVLQIEPLTGLQSVGSSE